MKTSELTGAALDWAVAKCKQPSLALDHFKAMHDHYAYDYNTFNYSTDWSQGGPIIEREKISVEYSHEEDWHATIGCTPHDFLLWDQPYGTEVSYAEGPTPLIAAMRCYVASKMGDEVDIPEEPL